MDRVHEICVISGRVLIASSHYFYTSGVLWSECPASLALLDGCIDRLGCSIVFAFIIFHLAIFTVE